MEFFIVNLPRRVLAHGFKHGNDVQFLLRFCREAARQNRAAINKHGGSIHPCHRHERARHIFIAAANGHIPIHPGATHHGFD